MNNIVHIHRNTILPKNGEINFEEKKKHWTVERHCHKDYTGGQIDKQDKNYMSKNFLSIYISISFNVPLEN